MKFPGYKNLRGPEILVLQEPGKVIRAVASIDDYKLSHRMHIAESNSRVWLSAEKTTARVNHGRWVADCVWCKQVMITRPDWGRGVLLDLRCTF